MDLVIGIGNDWRGDDGLGPRVVDALSARPGLETMTVHQLVPELAERLRGVDRVLFVDAGAGAETVHLQRIEPTPHRGLGHACPPGALLEWTAMAYERVPQAWLLTVPGVVFEPGTGLSRQAEARVPEAVARIDAWLNAHPQPVAVTNEEEA